LGEIAVPGESIGVIEEFAPGENVYVLDGEIVSKIVGLITKDMRKLRVDVKLCKNPPFPKKDDIIYGFIERIKDVFAVVKIFYIENRNLVLPLAFTGTLHIMNIGGERVGKVYDVYGYGDIIRAKILLNKGPPFLLTTIGRDLGVILARCPKCMAILKKRGLKLFCTRCRINVRRKVAFRHYILK